jgi:hypothetical protein
MTRLFPQFETEAALCQAFALRVPAEWIVYPETAGWDLLLVHRQGGWQIGIEAKLTLNAKVLAQAIKGRRWNSQGPDFRAVLVGKVVAESAELAAALGITVISPAPLPREPDWGGVSWAPRSKQGPKVPEFKPDLPSSESLTRIGEWWSNYDRPVWHDQFPLQRHRLPDYVPEVAAGVPSPMILSDWKIKAMRVCVWVQRHGTITRKEFRALGIDPSRWMNGAWLKPCSDRGVWTAGPQFPAAQLAREHPAAWQKVQADYDAWSQKVTVAA